MAVRRTEGDANLPRLPRALWEDTDATGRWAHRGFSLDDEDREQPQLVAFRRWQTAKAEFKAAHGLSPSDWRAVVAGDEAFQRFRRARVGH